MFKHARHTLLAELRLTYGCGRQSSRPLAIATEDVGIDMVTQKSPGGMNGRSSAKDVEETLFTCSSSFERGRIMKRLVEVGSLLALLA